MGTSHDTPGKERDRSADRKVGPSSAAAGCGHDHGVEGGHDPDLGVDPRAGNAATAAALDDKGEPTDPEAGRERHEKEPSTFAEAISQNAAEHRHLAAFLERHAARELDPEDPRSRANLLRNSAQWVLDGKATITLLTPVHDSAERDLPEKKMAWFDPENDWKEGISSYEPFSVSGSNDGLEIAGWNAYGALDATGTTIDVFGAADEAKLEESLVHEVQHDADGHSRKAEDHHTPTNTEVGPQGEDPTKAGRWVYDRFDSEFRGFWLNDLPELGSPDERATNYFVKARFGDVFANTLTGFENQRQADIFHQLRSGKRDREVWLTKDYDWTTTYGFIPHFYALDADFRKHVDGTTGFVSANGVNSVRIQALSEAVAGTDVDAVMAAARGLDTVDRKWLRDEEQSKPFWEHVDRRLDSAQRQALVDLIAQPEPTRALAGVVVGAAAAGAADGEARGPRTVIVQQGDQLGTIAERELGDASRWREIYELNKEVIRNPHVIRRGTELRLPE